MEASVATPAQGTAAQPGAPGQDQSTGAGKGAGQQGSQFNWDVFPDVPEAQRELLEPHLRGVQGHVTKMEQQYAPYKSLMDFVSADQVSPLMGFLEAYQNDPVATLLGMAGDLQQRGSISPDVDMQALQALVTGQAQQQAAQAAQPGAGEQIPEWAQQLISRMDQNDARSQQAEQAEQQAAQEAELDQIFNQAKTEIREQLTAAGISEEHVPDEMIRAAIIANDGDGEQAALQLKGMRDNFLAAFAQANGGPKPPQVKGDLPQPKKGQRRGDGFDEAREKSRQLLAQRAQAQAQE